MLSQRTSGLKGLAVVPLDVRRNRGLKAREETVNSLVEGVPTDP